MQTSITQDPDIAEPGVLLANSGNIIISGWSEQRIPPGRLVTYGGPEFGAAPQKVIVPTTSTHIDRRAVGIVMKDTSIEFDGVGYKPHTVFPILRRGHIWVASEDTVAEAFSQAQARFVATPLHGGHGTIRRLPVTTQTQTIVGALFVTATAGPGQVAVLELDGMRGLV